MVKAFHSVEMRRTSLAVFMAGILLSSLIALLPSQVGTANADTSCLNPPSGLISWWPGQGNGNDISGSNNGNVLSGTTFETAQVGQGFKVISQPAGTGAGSSAISGSTAGFPLGSSARTIIAWIKTSATPDPTFGSGIFHYGTEDGSLPPKNFHLFVHPDGSAGVGNGFGFGTVTGSSPVTDNQFHLVAGTYEGSSTNIARIYVDAVEEASAAITTPGTGNADPFRIGSYMPSGPSRNFEHGHFDGIIDEVAIFNRALTQSEIEAIHDAGMSGMCTTVSTGPIINPVNGHYYEAVRAYGGINWFSANNAAQAMSFAGAQGHLASINSQQEQDFVVNNLPQVKAPTTSPFGAGHWLGGFQPSGSPEPAGGWRWTTAEGFHYAAWIPGEPNNFGGGEDGVAYWWYPGATGSGAHWSDIPRNFAAPGYVIEYEPTNLVFNPANGHYYEAVPTTVNGINWDNAKSAAESRTHSGAQGTLATISDQAEQDFIVNNLPQVKAPVILHGAGYWLGGFQPSGSAEPAGGWRWTTAEHFFFTFWQPGEPNNNGGNEDALIFWGNPGTNSGDGKKWNDAPRNFAAPGYVVEYVPTNLVLDPTSGHYYEAVPALDGLTWLDAKTAAESRTHEDRQGHLATITSLQEQNFIVSNLPQVKAPQSSPHGAGYWLGGLQAAGSAEPADGWQWITGEAFSVFNQWIVGEPNNCVCAGTNEDGLIFWWYPGATGSGGHWNDIPRTFSYFGYVVEYENAPPMADANGPYDATEGVAVTLDGSGSSDSDGNIVSYEWDLDNDGQFDDATGAMPDAVFDDNGVYPISLKVTDNSGLTSTDTSQVNVANANPVVDAGSEASLNEGDTFSAAGSFTDSGADDSWTATVDYGDGSGSQPLALDADMTFSLSHTYPDDDIYMITVTVTDDDGGAESDMVQVTVANVAPELGAITAPIAPQQVNTAVETSASFTDVGVLDTHSAEWDWGDGSASAGTITEADGSGMVQGTHSYATPGVYTVQLILTDDDGDSDTETFQYVVIYDPTAGFVTGGGWINSPTGAYAEDASLEGKAIFGFTSKYEKGATTPTGKTNFKFHVADLDFNSNTYDWLVVAGAKAQYKGVGTVNGDGDYGFMLTAIDGQINGGGGADKFRIKIWDMATETVVYDNQMEAADDANPTTVIGGGQIKIHK